MINRWSIDDRSIDRALSLSPSLRPSVRPSVCSSVRLSWKRSYSARLPPFLNLTTSKTRQFCQTSSIFEVGNVKNEAILRDLLQKWKAECRADGLVPMRFAFVSFHLSKVLRLPRKSEARSYEVLHLSRKNILANLTIWCTKMQPLSGNQRPDLLTSLMNMSLVLRLPREMHLCRSSSNVPGLPMSLKQLQNPHVLLTFRKDRKVQIPLRLPGETTSERPKMVRACVAFNMLTSKCASRHNRVHFFASATSLSAPTLVCFVRLCFDMCFAPQQRALFRHLSSWKCSGAEVFSTFWLRNALRATTACNFSSPIWPDDSALAAIASLLFDPPEPQIIGKNTVIRDFSAFSRTCIFFLLFSSLLFSSLLFSSLTFSDSSHLCFFIYPYCRKFDF